MGANAINAGTSRDALFYPAVQANSLGECRVDDWRQCFVRLSLSVAPRFLWECLTSPIVSWFPAPPPQTQRADFPHWPSCVLRIKGYAADACWVVFSGWLIVTLEQPDEHFDSTETMSDAEVAELAEPKCAEVKPGLISPGGANGVELFRRVLIRCPSTLDLRPPLGEDPRHSRRL
jgi:hypothetical protein